jgi:hypothetical protein
MEDAALALLIAAVTSGLQWRRVEPAPSIHQYLEHRVRVVPMPNGERVYTESRPSEMRLENGVQARGVQIRVAVFVE